MFVRPTPPPMAAAVVTPAQLPAKSWTFFGWYTLPLASMPLAPTAVVVRPSILNFYSFP